MMTIAKAFTILSIAIAPNTVLSQSARPSFEVAAIKPNNSGSRNSMSGIRPGGYYIATNIPVKFLIVDAYRVMDFQVQGGPSWISSDGFDIEARAEPGTVPPAGPPDVDHPDTMALMIQSLLADRFKLKLHHELKELPVYNLVVAKDGPKLKHAVENRPGPGGLAPGNISTNGTASGVQMNASAISLAMLAKALSQQLRRPVIDRTNIAGAFDITLKWVPEARPSALTAPAAGDAPLPDPSATSIFTAIQEQLGLKLESTRGSVDVLVIDSVEKPSDN